MVIRVVRVVRVIRLLSSGLLEKDDSENEKNEG
jgi:hypothetical protein